MNTLESFQNNSLEKWWRTSKLFSRFIEIVQRLIVIFCEEKLGKYKLEPVFVLNFRKTRNDYSSTDFYKEWRKIVKIITYWKEILCFVQRTG